MIQLAIVLALFALSLFYVGRMMYRNFTRKTGCAEGCGKCGVDFSKIAQQIENKSTN